MASLLVTDPDQIRSSVVMEWGIDDSIQWLQQPLRISVNVPLLFQFRVIHCT